MKLGLVRPPLIGHEQRGTGAYRRQLKSALDNYAHVKVVDAAIDQLPDGVDLFHFPFFDPFFLTLPIIRQKPTVVTIHDLIPIRFPRVFPRGIRGELKWQVQKRMVRRVEAIITDSKASKKDIVNFVGVSKKKIHVIYLAAGDEFMGQVQPMQLDKARIKYNLPDKFVLFIGEPNWNKNLINVIRAVKQARVPLVVVSRTFAQRSFADYHPWLKTCEEAENEAKTYNKVIRLENVPAEDLVVLYKSATVLLHPSYYEGFGLPVVEAFAAGCPVITTHKGSLREVASEGAVIVDTSDVNKMASELTKILSNKSYREKLVNKGKKQVEKFSWEKTARETEEVYKRILDG